MKTVTEKYYICEICGKTSKNEQKIKECQESHRSITDDCQIEQVYQNGNCLLYTSPSPRDGATSRMPSSA